MLYDRDMDALSILRGMAENNAWSNLRLHAVCARLDETAYRAPRTGFFPSIHETLLHILCVDTYYVDALAGGGRGRASLHDEAGHTSFEPVRAAQRIVDRRLFDFVARLTDADLALVVSIDRADHVQKERVVDVLQHVFVHQVHHRGQAHAMLSGTTLAPPPLDEFFMKEEAPLREAELRELGLPLR